MNSVKLAPALLSLALFAYACGGSSMVERPAQAPAANSNRAASNTGVGAPPDDLAKARTTYMQVCANCHQADGAGGAVEIEGKKLKVPSLRSDRAKGHADERYHKQIVEGGDGMPAFKGRLSDEDINALIRLIRKEFQSGAAPSGD